MRTLPVLVALAASLCAQQPGAPKPQDTEVWEPVPRIVTPGATDAAPPSDAIVLFDGKNLDQWVSAADRSPGMSISSAESSPLLTISLKANPRRWRCPKPTQQMRAGNP